MRKSFLFLLIFFMMCSTFFGCQSGPDAKDPNFLTNGDFIFVNSQDADILTFRTAVFSKAPITDISFAGLEGTNVSSGDFQVELIDNNPALDNYAYRDAYLKYLEINVTPPENFDESCEITAVLFNVDGTQRKISFGTPLKHTFTGGNVATEALSFAIPSEIASDAINNSEQSIPYMLIANEEVILQKVSFTDIFEAGDMKIFIGNESLDSTAFPITLPQGETAVISLTPTSTKANALSYASANIFFEFTTQGASTPSTNSACLIFDPILSLTSDDTTAINKWIDAVFFNEQS